MDFLEEIAAGPMQRDDNKGGKTMRITKRQLRRIIREEKARILKESLGNVHDVVVSVDGTERDYASYTYYGIGTIENAVDGDLLNPQDLRRLADAIERDMSAEPGQQISLEID